VPLHFLETITTSCTTFLLSNAFTIKRDVCLSLSWILQWRLSTSLGGL